MNFVNKKNIKDVFSKISGCLNNFKRINYFFVEIYCYPMAALRISVSRGYPPSRYHFLMRS